MKSENGKSKNETNDAKTFAFGNPASSQSRINSVNCNALSAIYSGLNAVIIEFNSIALREV